MISNAKIGAAVVGGYLLGRTKKAKMAIGLGMFLAGRKLSLNPRELGKLVANSPVLGPLNDQVRAELVDATKSAATSAMTQRMSHLADSLHERTLGLGESDEPQDRADEPADDADQDADVDAESDTDTAPHGDRDDGDDQGSADSRGGSGAETARRKKPARTAKSTADKASSGARRGGSGAAGAARKSASTGARKTASGTARKTTSGARKTASAARRTAERGGRND
ncbi:hypothetical protein QOM21_03855 [Streptomyces sp. Pv4-95]|uniref:hypothetical protein n=1 Tax=Streptomyces sp. Pv4-95 TaxID=3049543 RepID=UPI003892BAD0